MNATIILFAGWQCLHIQHRGVISSRLHVTITNSFHSNHCTVAGITSEFMSPRAQGALEHMKHSQGEKTPFSHGLRKALKETSVQSQVHPKDN